MLHSLTFPVFRLIRLFN